MLGKVTNRMPSGEKAMNRKGPRDSVVNKDIWNPSGRVSGKLVSFTVWDAAAGVRTSVEVGPSVAVGDGVAAPVTAGCRVGVTTGWRTGVGEGSRVKASAGVGSGAGVWDWSATLEGAISGVAVENRVAVGSEEPQALRMKTIGINAVTASPIHDTIYSFCLTILC